MQQNNLSAISPINIKWSNKYSEVLYKAAMLRAAKLNFPKKIRNYQYHEICIATALRKELEFQRGHLFHRNNRFITFRLN